jgi:hypothetical protein
MPFGLPAFWNHGLAHSRPCRFWAVRFDVLVRHRKRRAKPAPRKADFGVSGNWLWLNRAEPFSGLEAVATHQSEADLAVALRPEVELPEPRSGAQ